MANDKKFPDFTSGGNMRQGDVAVGLRSSNLTTNYKFDLPGTGLEDVNGNFLINWESVGISAVNYPKIINSLTNNPVIYGAAGEDDNVDIAINPKGSGFLFLDQLRWPGADGTPGQIMVTDGDGHLSFFSLFPDVSDATFIIQTANEDLPNAQVLADLTTGILKSTASSGQLSISAPLTTIDNLSIVLGDTIYGSDSATYSKLSGNITATQKFMSQTGTGTASAAPQWVDIEAGDITNPGALTRTNDTNVTITLSGTPNAALLQDVLLTAGWSGILAETRGGTGLGSYTTDDMLYASGTNTLTTFPSTAFSRNLLAGEDETDWQTNLFLVPGTDIQVFSAALTSIAGLVTSANKMIYTTDVDTYDVTALTSFMRTALSSVDAAAAASNLEVVALSGSNMTGPLVLYGDPASGTEAATRNYVDSVVLNSQIACLCATTTDLTGYIYNNGAAGVGATLTAAIPGVFTTDGITPDIGNRVLVLFQSDASQNGAYDLTAGDVITPAVLTRSTDYDDPSQIQAGDQFAVVQGTTYGATLWFNSQVNPVTIGTTDITFRQVSPTGSLLVSANLGDLNNPATARVNLSLEVGVDVQAYSDTLESISPLGTAGDVTLYTTGVNTWAETPLPAFGRTLIANSSAAGARSSLGLVIGTNVQQWFAALDSIGGLSTSANQMIYTTALNVYATTAITALGRTFVGQSTTAGMRSTIGSVIGTDVQAHADVLDSIVAANITTNNMIYGTGANAVATTASTLYGRSLLNQANASAARNTLGLSQGSIYLIDTSISANSVTCTAPSGYVSYATGDTFEIKINNTNTSSVTINIGSIGSVSLIRDLGSLVANEIISQNIYTIVFNGTSFEVLNPAQAFYGISVYLIGSQVVGSGTDTNVRCASIESDLNNIYNTSTWLTTISRRGWYNVNGNVEGTCSTANNLVNASIRKNNVIYKRLSSFYAANPTNSFSVNGNIKIQVNAGDTIGFFINNTTSSNITFGGQTMVYFQLEWCGYA